MKNKYFQIIHLGDSMFSKHLIINNEKEEILYLFVDVDFEFASLGSNETKETALFTKILHYIRTKKIPFNGQKIVLVVNGIIFSLLLLHHPLQVNKETTEFKYVEYLKPFTQTPVLKEETKDITKDVAVNTVITESKKIEKNETIRQSDKIIIPPTIKTEIENESPTPKTELPNNQLESPATLEKKSDITVPVYRSTGIIEHISLEEYIIGVVGAEMPASFHEETLKAQSLLARTYILKKLNTNTVVTDNESTQAYKDIEQLKQLWGNSFDTYYNKIKDAVNATKDQVITYHGTLIEAVYHSTSNGITENAVDVWGTSFPYLISVDSHWDLQASSYLREKQMDLTTINQILGTNINQDTVLEVVSKTTGNNILKYKIDETTYDALMLRSLLGLRSTDFDIIINNDIVSFVTRGYGHGVGMSQYGANGMAKEGFTYKDIITHYYPGVTIEVQ